MNDLLNSAKELLAVCDTAAAIGTGIPEITALRTALEAAERSNVCDQCGSAELEIVKAFIDVWQPTSFDADELDAHQDHDRDSAWHMALACPQCDGRIVPGTHWIEP